MYFQRVLSLASLAPSIMMAEFSDPCRAVVGSNLLPGRIDTNPEVYSIPDPYQKHECRLGNSGVYYVQLMGTGNANWESCWNNDENWTERTLCLRNTDAITQRRCMWIPSIELDQDTLIWTWCVHYIGPDETMMVQFFGTETFVEPKPDAVDGLKIGKDDTVGEGFWPHFDEELTNIAWRYSNEWDDPCVGTLAPPIAGQPYEAVDRYSQPDGYREHECRGGDRGVYDVKMIGNGQYQQCLSDTFGRKTICFKNTHSTIYECLWIPAKKRRLNDGGWDVKWCLHYIGPNQALQVHLRTGTEAWNFHGDFFEWEQLPGWAGSEQDGNQIWGLHINGHSTRLQQAGGTNVQWGYNAQYVNLPPWVSCGTSYSESQLTGGNWYTEHECRGGNTGVYDVTLIGRGEGIYENCLNEVDNTGTNGQIWCFHNDATNQNPCLSIPAKQDGSSEAKWCVHHIGAGETLRVKAKGNWNFFFYESSEGLHTTNPIEAADGNQLDIIKWGYNYQRECGLTGDSWKDEHVCSQPDNGVFDVRLLPTSDAVYGGKSNFKYCQENKWAKTTYCFINKASYTHCLWIPGVPSNNHGGDKKWCKHHVGPNEVLVVHPKAGWHFDERNQNDLFEVGVFAEEKSNEIIYKLDTQMKPAGWIDTCPTELVNIMRYTGTGYMLHECRGDGSGAFYVQMFGKSAAEYNDCKNTLFNERTMCFKNKDTTSHKCLTIWAKKDGVEARQCVHYIGPEEGLKVQFYTDDWNFDFQESRIPSAALYSYEYNRQWQGPCGYYQYLVPEANIDDFWYQEHECKGPNTGVFDVRLIKVDDPNLHSACTNNQQTTCFRNGRSEQVCLWIFGEHQSGTEFKWCVHHIPSGEILVARSKTGWHYRNSNRAKTDGIHVNGETFNREGKHEINGIEWGTGLVVPTGSPTTSSPTQSPTSSPTESPTTGSPTKSPTTGSPSKSPTTGSPSTASPTKFSPTKSPTTDSPTKSTPKSATTETTETPVTDPADDDSSTGKMTKRSFSVYCSVPSCKEYENSCEDEIECAKEIIAQLSDNPPKSIEILDTKCGVPGRRLLSERVVIKWSVTMAESELSLYERQVTSKEGKRIKVKDLELVVVGVVADSESENSKTDEDNTIWYVIGGVAGGVIIIVLVGVLWCKASRRSDDSASDSSRRETRRRVHVPADGMARRGTRKMERRGTRQVNDPSDAMARRGTRKMERRGTRQMNAPSDGMVRRGTRKMERRGTRRVDDPSNFNERRGTRQMTRRGTRRMSDPSDGMMRRGTRKMQRTSSEEPVRRGTRVVDNKSLPRKSSSDDWGTRRGTRVREEDVWSDDGSYDPNWSDDGSYGGNNPIGVVIDAQFDHKKRRGTRVKKRGSADDAAPDFRRVTRKERIQLKRKR